MRRFAFAGLCVLAAGLVAWRTGGGAEIPASPPRPVAETGDAGAAAQAGASAPASVAEAYETETRLVDALEAARVDAPPLGPAGQRILGSHWRKMKPPFVNATGDAAKYVTSIALRMSATETQWAAPQKDGSTWAPDARVWNMNEGSFDQREAIVAMAPSSFTFRITVPRGGRLAFAEGTVSATKDTTVFVVTVIEESGRKREVYRHRLPPSAARRWNDAVVDLASYAGQSVDLRLSTEISPATDEELKVLPSKSPAFAGAGSGGKKKKAKDTGPPPAGGDESALSEAILASPAPVPVVLWGNPEIRKKSAATRVPYNVLWIVVDALRPDVIPSMHDDADDQKKLDAESPPLEAMLPKIPGLTPAIDDLVHRGVRFSRAYSGASWTRPGTLAMLSGARSGELGIETLNWVLSPADLAHFYTTDPPLLPLELRRHGASSRAFVNNYFMVGYTPVGLEMGFERVSDHRYRTRDTLEVTEDAVGWLQKNADDRFFLFVNYNSPHEPYEPPKKFEDRVPGPPAGPKDRNIRLYMAEAAKDDEAIGVLMRAIDDLHLRERTIVVVTSDHGETMSSAHQGLSGIDHMPIRFHHAVANFEETTRVPIVLVAPGLLPADRDVKERIRSIDLAPTILELEGLEPHPRMSGKSLVALAKGQKEKDERVVITEGRGTRAVIYDRWRLVTREGNARMTILPDHTVTAGEELYDLDNDPGERRDVSPARPEIVAEMRARMTAAMANVPVAGTAAAVAPVEDTRAAGAPVVHLRFAGGGKHHRIAGTVYVQNGQAEVTPVELGREAFTAAGSKVDVAFTTSDTAIVGFDLTPKPSTATLSWELFLDDAPWTDDMVFGGPFGVTTPVLRHGIASDEARTAAQGASLPIIDPLRDLGLFVTREKRSGEGEAPESHDDAEGAEETARLLREWGYAQSSTSAKGRH